MLCEINLIQGLFAAPELAKLTCGANKGGELLLPGSGEDGDQLGVGPGNSVGRWECADWYGCGLHSCFPVKMEQLRFVHFDVSKFATIPQKGILKKKNWVEGRGRNA